MLILHCKKIHFFYIKPTLLFNTKYRICHNFSCTQQKPRKYAFLKTRLISFAFQAESEHTNWYWETPEAHCCNHPQTSQAERFSQRRFYFRIERKSKMLHTKARSLSYRGAILNLFYCHTKTTQIEDVSSLDKQN